MQAMIMAVCMVMVVALPVDQDFARHVESFIEMPANEELGQQLQQAIAELKKRQEQAADDQDKKIALESQKSEKVEAEGKKVQGELKAQIAAYEQKLQETEKKIKDADAKIVPAREEALKLAKEEGDKKIKDESAKAKGLQDHHQQLMATEAKKLSDTEKEFEKKFKEQEKTAKVALDKEISEQEKKTGEAHKVITQINAESEKKMQDASNAAGDLQKKAQDDFAKSKDDLTKHGAEDKAKINLDSSAQINSLQKELHDAESKIPVAKDEVKKHFAPLLAAEEKEKTDLTTKVIDATKNAVDQEIQVKKLTADLKNQEDKNAKDLVEKQQEMDRILQLKIGEVQRVQRETDDLKAKVSSVKA